MFEKTSPEETRKLTELCAAIYDFSGTEVLFYADT